MVNHALRNWSTRSFLVIRCCAVDSLIRNSTRIHGLTQEGKQSAHALSITGPRRFLVVEFDQGHVDEHAALLLHLAEFAPLTMAVHSGGKSIHGWFARQDRSGSLLRRFMRYAVSLGADHATWCKSQFVRMPDGLRANGRRQTVLYFDPATIR
jgi:hypothetical protein